ncbi:MAG: hypothetical protein ACLT8E_06555 [Akkermansia sp.]
MIITIPSRGIWWAFYALGRKPVVYANDDPRILDLAGGAGGRVHFPAPAIRATPGCAWSS